jgi:hypothetical protein
VYTLYTMSRQLIGAVVGDDLGYGAAA